VNAHEHHPEAAHPGTRSSADADPGVGKRPLVADDPTATAASHHHHTAEFYKTRADQFVADMFNTKVRAIDNFAPSLTKSAKAPHSLLGDAVAFAIGAAAGPFVDALEVGAVAAVIIKEAIPHFAGAVGQSVSGKGADPNPVDVATFATLYGHAINEHRSIVSHNLKSKIDNEQEGKRITEALHGDLVAGHLYLTTTQVGSLNGQTQRETLDAWTVAMQKVGDKKDHGQQGYSDPSTGQLHLDGLLLHLNGKLVPGGTARMEGVGNAAAQLNGNRKLKDIKVQRTMNVRWDYPDGTGGFGLSISASGVMKDDELGWDDKAAAAMFYDNKKDLFPVTSDDVNKDRAIAERNYRKGLHKIWNIVNDQTPHELGFSMKGD
jgi:hypothetical protein